MNNDDQPPKIIPSKFDKNNASPTEDRIVKIYKDGDVDFFIRCGDWGHKSNDNRQNVYYKFSFQVKTNFYGKNYDSVDNFVSAIQKEQIKGLTVSIIQPNKELTDVYGTQYNKEIQNINIEITDILNDMKDIGADNDSLTVNMVKFLTKHGLLEEALRLYGREFKKHVEIVANIKNKELEKLLKKKDEEYAILLNKISKAFEQQLEKKEKEYAILLNKKDEKYNKVLEDNQGLEKQLKESERVRERLSEINEELRKQLEENKKKFPQQLKKTNKDLKDPLYKKKDKGFLSIFSCCTCGLDNVAEMEEGKDEMNINS